MRIHFKSLAIAACAVIQLFSMPAHAEVFKSSEFLTWKLQNQASYIDTSIGMASLVAAQNSKTQSKCIDDWYIADQTKSVEYITGIMRDNPTYHPRGVILAAIEKKCGSMTY